MPVQFENAPAGSLQNSKKWFPYMSRESREQVHTMNQLITTLVEQEHKTVYPPRDKIYNALKLTPPDKVKAIIIGQDPYHEPHQANGLAFSVDAPTKIPPSLRNIFIEMHNDLGIDIPTTGDLTPWARAGVLLLNATLSVEAHKANSHQKLGWDMITQEILRVALRFGQPKVIMCWGSFAYRITQDAMRVIQPQHVCVLRSTHPSPLSAYKGTVACPAFMGSRPFSKANAFLVSQGVEPIDWRL